MNVRPLILASLAIAALTLGTGCSNKTSAEHDSLVKQNKDLQAQLDQEKAARAAAESRANAATDSATAAPATEPAAPSMESTDTTGGVAVGDTSSVGGVSRGQNEHGENTITVASDILFDSGKATLKPAAKHALDHVASILKKEYPGRELRVEGYTDPNPVHSSGWDDNWDLGAARARSVLLYLETKGIHHMYIASFGDTKAAGAAPAPTKKTKGKTTKSTGTSAYAADRRVQIVVVKNGM